MGQALAPRVVRSGPYWPTVPRSGGEGDALIWLKQNLVTMGRDGHYYEQVYGGELDLGDTVPLVALTGTIAVASGSRIVTGTGTLFLTELFIGQRVLIIDQVGMQTIPLFVKRILSDTSYEAWRPSTATLAGQTGWRMSRLGAVNNKRFTMLWGNIVQLDRGSYLSVGDGVVQVNGATLQGSSLTATRAPQISLFDSTTNNYTNFTLGMSQPTGITAANVAGGVKGMRAGNYSLVVSRGRKQTGGYNNPSLRIDVTLTNNDKVRITFPAMEAATGQTSWIVFVTPYTAALSSDLRYLEGPWFLLVKLDNVQVNPAGGTFDVEWYDAEILGQDPATFNNDPPPQAVFVELLNSIPVWISMRGPSFTRVGPVTTVDPSPGPFIGPAKPRNIEAAPAILQFSSSPPETIIGAVSSGQGRIYLLTQQHLQIAQATASDVVPIIIRPFWRDGFANPEGLVFVNDILYGFPMGGPSRSVGDGDEQEAERDWAAPVDEIVSTWTPGHVLVAYDPFYNAIWFFHSADALNSSGFWTTRVLMWGLGQNHWIGDLRISRSTQDSIVCGVATVGDKLNFIMGGRGVQ